METRQHTATNPRLKPSKFGGLNHLERNLGMRQDASLSPDAVFVSLDLEVASDRDRLHLSSEKPIIRQLGFARLDSRDIRSLSLSSDVRNIISVSVFDSSVLPKSKMAKARQKRGEPPRIFAQTQYITQDEIPTTLSQNLLIRDYSNGSETIHLQNIVLVGHSIRQDLKVLRFLDINISEIAPILTIIDTHAISRYVFPPFHPNLVPTPNRKFSLVAC
jgi:hypothetical protein